MSNPIIMLWFTSTFSSTPVMILFLGPLFGCLLSIFILHKWHNTHNLNAFKIRDVRYVPQRSIILSGLFNERLEKQRLEVIRREGKVFGFYMLGEPTVVCQDPEVIQLVMSREFTSFTDRRPIKIDHKLFQHSITSVECEKWKRLRAIVSPTFAVGKLRLIYLCIDDTCQQFVQKLSILVEKGGNINMKREVGEFTMNTVMQTLFGVQVDFETNTNKDNILLQKARQVFSNNMSVRNIVIFMLNLYLPRVGSLAARLGFQFLGEEFSFFTKFVTGVVQQRRETVCQKGSRVAKANCLIEFLLEAEQENQLLESAKINNNDNDSTISSKVSKYMTMDEMVVQSMILLTAGYDTSSTAISLCLYYLALNPKCQNRLIEEIITVTESLGKLESEQDKPVINFDTLAKFEYLTCVVNETLRLNPPAHFVERRASRDICLETQTMRITLKRGDIFRVETYALHRDPDQFPDPESFKPERFLGKPTFHNYAYIPFGSGPRNCVAKPMALLLVKLTLLHLIRNFRFSLCNQTTIPLEYNRQLHFLSPKDVILRVEKR